MGEIVVVNGIEFRLRSTSFREGTRLDRFVAHAIDQRVLLVRETNATGDTLWMVHCSTFGGHGPTPEDAVARVVERMRDTATDLSLRADALSARP